MSAEVDSPPGFQSNSGRSSEDQDAESPNQTKIKPVPLFLNLTRCASCYNHKKRLRRGSWDGESSSSAEDSGPDRESDAESSSSSSSSADALSETQEKCETETPPPDQVETAEPESGGKTDGDRQEVIEGVLENAEDKGVAKSVPRRAPLIKSYSLPCTFPPHLIPWSNLPRPPTVVSTLRLQVSSQEQADDPVFVIQPHLSEQAEEHHGQVFNNPPYPLTNMLPWQQRSLPSLQQQQPPYPHQQPLPELSHQQPPPRFEPPLTQMFPPAAHTHPVLHPQPLYPPLHTPHTHLQAPRPQPCWCCYSMQYPYTF